MIHICDSIAQRNQSNKTAFQNCQQVRVELAPWEKRIGEVAGRISVVASERDVLAKKVGRKD